jgi:hypothetical protein
VCGLADETLFPPPEQPQCHLNDTQAPARFVHLQVFARRPDYVRPQTIRIYGDGDVSGNDRPAAGRALDREAAPERGQAVAESDEPAALEPGPPTPSWRTWTRRMDASTRAVTETRSALA